MDQISYSLFFRDLIGYREDPDIFILINVPDSVIDERIKGRRVCPLCQTSRNLPLLPTSKVGFDKKKQEFYLLCDNPKCKEVPLKRKEGDEFGIKPIQERLKLDDKLIEMAFLLHGVPKILLRNTVPKKGAEDFIDDYEITPQYEFEWDESLKTIKRIEKPWVVLDENGEEIFSLLAPPVLVSLIKQMVEVLNL